MMRGSIRSKIVFPFLILTIAVAVLGVFVVTRLIAASLEERLVNQVLEAGRVAADSIVRQENRHLEVLRVMSGTIGVADAIQAENVDALRDLLEFHATNANVDAMIVLGEGGQPIMRLDAVRQTNINVVDSYQLTVGGTPMQQLGVVQQVIDGQGDRFAQLVETPTGTLLLSSAGVYEGDRLIGIIVVGTRMERIVQQMKAEALADLAIYTGPQTLVASSVPDWQQPDQYTNLIFDESAYEAATSSEETTPIRETELYGRTYRVGFGPLVVRGDTIGMLGVMLPNSFVVQTITTSRATFLGIFTVAGLGVAVMGVIIAQRIVGPIRELVAASQAVAEGDFSVRATNQARDEIGVLTNTFNVMTDRLADYTNALEEENARTRAIINSTRDGLIVRNVAGEVTLINPAAEALLAHADEDILKRLRAAEIGTTTNQRIQVGDRTLSVNAARVTSAEGTTFGEVLLLRDVTQEAIAERTKDNFLNQIGHEFRTPLTSLKLYAEVLGRGWEKLSDERREKALHEVYDKTTVVADMVDELIEMTTIEGGDVNLRRETIGLGALVGDVIEAWRAETGHTITVSGEDAIRLHVDAKRMRRALDHIVANAVRYSPAGDPVAVRMWRDAGEAVIEVEDSGVGIRSDQVGRVFDRFYRGEPVTADGRPVDVRGMGQGLYVTRMIIESHGGSISLESQQHEGTTVTVRLPHAP